MTDRLMCSVSSASVYRYIQFGCRYKSDFCHSLCRALIVPLWLPCQALFHVYLSGLLFDYKFKYVILWHPVLQSIYSCLPDCDFCQPFSVALPLSLSKDLHYIPFLPEWHYNMMLNRNTGVGQKTEPQLKGTKLIHDEYVKNSPTSIDWKKIKNQ